MVTSGLICIWGSDSVREVEMDRYECGNCGTIYDPAKGTPARDIPPGTPYEDLPSDWQCPVCGSSKDKLRKME